ncbi:MULTISPECIES: multiple monosaccharide ABC transporter ATP-binding protein [Streptomyces]|uniref:Multiple monosaccharide ABC transporter ATP-binding protein n=4 Tax=Streptomyces violaceoruber group TaxID=2867121 RepID=A0ACD4WTG9_STRVN|nr:MULTISPECIES: multiple monosaccharide ABC transporter ATP-binding protein [Streptomyces]BDD71957.1 xylose ABC transporter ATP-binding protein [Streptomyces coelicolor]MBQ0947971.1 sugar ABC transporter ATP-binding protein [Streptomyces sp. RK76]MCW8118977.1 sugar ABC transporter ATP-binding protein [Streptomyces anthocyanicus]MCZ4635710.1 sugar ABC transporter ATP-binding protein [Streptomyces rubrogriseus]MDX3346339.1 sugar ABC transporter ATP-binding protein [Streptomyces sp. ME02-6979A]
MAGPVLEMRSIVKTFPGVKALSDVTLTVRQGEVHAICGENGAGKSTLMKVLSGVHPHGSYEGDVLFEGETCRFKDIRASEQHGIVIIHQELALVPYLSIAENIFLGNEQATRGVISWNETLRRATELMRRVGLHEHPQTRVADIGVGKQQLVEIAKALSKKVKLLVLDEPTAALNDEDSAKLLELILELKSQGMTSIIISHKLNEIRTVADSVTILRDGRTIETLDVKNGETTEDRIISGMIGRDLDHRFPERTPHRAEAGAAPALEIRDWTVHHPIDQQRKVVDGVSINVRRGEIVGIAGLMGAGRTELAMSVFGRTYGRYAGGTVLKDGREIRTKTVPEAVAHGIAYVTEDRKHYGLNLDDTIGRNISLSGLGKVARRGVVDEHEERMVAERFRESMNIKTPNVAERVGKLSGGNQQKVVLSKWIFVGPDVLFLDEPTRGIDVGAKFEIYTVIDKLAAEGKAVLFISSELPELLGMCDRIYTMAAGRLTGEFSRAEAAQDVLMRQMTKDKEVTR